jgi:hypothetical protein
MVQGVEAGHGHTERIKRGEEGHSCMIEYDVCGTVQDIGQSVSYVV